jgi:hypothetical protein
MDQKEFNRALSDYLNNKKENQLDKYKLIEKLKKRSLKQRDFTEEIPELKEDKVHIIEKEKTFLDGLLNFFKPIEKEKRVKQQPQPEVDISKGVQDEEFAKAEKELEIKISHPFLKKIVAFFTNLTKSYPKQEKVEEEVEERIEEEVTQEIQEFEEKEKELEKKEEALRKKKTQIIWDFISKINFLKQLVQKSEQQTEKIDSENDLKKIARITALVIKKLPSDEFQKFKTSDDFKKFREILQKHDIIKVKQKTYPEEEVSPNEETLQREEKKREQAAEDIARRIYRQEN